MQPIKKQQQQNETKKRFGLVEYQLSFLCTSLNNQRATILDRIELNSKPPSAPTPPPPRPAPAPPQIKDEAARRAKTCHFSVFQIGGAGSRFFINLVQDCRFSLTPVSYLTKCTIGVRRNRVVVWKMHLFALGKKGPVDCIKDHPILKK